MMYSCSVSPKELFCKCGGGVTMGVVWIRVYSGTRIHWYAILILNVPFEVHKTEKCICG